MSFSRFAKRGQEKKMGNTHVSLDGYSFGSKLEASVYQLLKLRMASGEFDAIQVQDHIYLSDARIGYVADFRCSKGDYSFWVEAKGFENDRWPTKKKLYKFYGPGKLEIWKGSYQRPFLDEVITPKPIQTHNDLTSCALCSEAMQQTRILHEVFSKPT